MRISNSWGLHLGQNRRLLETLSGYDLYNPSLIKVKEIQFKKKEANSPFVSKYSYLNSSVRPIYSAAAFQTTFGAAKVFPRREKQKKDQCQATPSAPAQDAPAYKKAQATSRRVRRGRHLGDSPTERVSPWKLCQQQSVVVERLLCWCLFLNLGEDLLSWRQRVMERVDEHSTAPYCTYMWDKAVIALSVSPQVEWSEWYCPAECSMKLSLRLAPSLCMG